MNDGRRQVDCLTTWCF